MIFLRLFIIIALCYIGWRVLRNRRGGKGVPGRKDTNSTPQDVLVEDPVCHVLIPKHQAVRHRRDGVTYYFCSEQCCDQFIETSEKGKL